ncbi:hypothetical protein Y032_0125g1277 [Ancylostoma ceylanicum]|uniref:Lipid-binding serum glycoprotein N-terminal domain-containing protein n=1 Tax=Ancylostoma ceylanicum TaxID=53326 RepID=A0A016T8R6_9BILA|nr:hypothetical protein Y032_0125g1277 [Ancylostoma ceylanicum]
MDNCRRYLSIFHFMLHTLLLLVLQLLHFTNAYNLVIDTQRKGINSYLQSFRKEYEKELENHAIPTITKKRCLGTVDLTEITVTNVTVESTMDVVVESDHYLRIEHLHARLHGLYRHNVLFIHNTGDFELSIRDLNATLGPLLPANIGGIPYLNQEISCSISHTEDKIIARGGILRWLAKKRLRDTMKEDLEGILCDSLVDILDVKIRRSLANLSLLLPVNEAITVSYLLSGQPFLLPHGAIRTYHLGVTSKNHIGEKFQPTTIESDHDVIYHIHEALLSEITDSVCKQGYMDGNITNDENQVRMVCQKASISVKNMEATRTANILLTLMLKFQDEEALVTRKYTVTVLYNELQTVVDRERDPGADTLAVCCTEAAGLLGRDTEGNRYVVISRCIRRCSGQLECPRRGPAPFYDRLEFTVCSCGWVI